MAIIRTIGIDPGSRITGYGIVEYNGHRCTHVAHGHLRGANRSLHQRLADIHRQLSSVIERWVPDDAAIEDVFLGKNPQSALTLGQARGAAVVAVSSYGLALTGYATRTIKQAVTGDGGADKKSINKVVKTHLCINGNVQTDAADALAIAICHAHSRRKAGSLSPVSQRRRKTIGRGLRF